MSNQSKHQQERTTRRIRLLPPEVIERIAAGEVIERPASVVRELIENALDADAKSIRITVRDGGLRLIAVADDGIGIAAEDLDAAATPHATSKIGTLDDLDHIASLGFRGEALASIAAVAELELTSSTDESGLARTLTIANGTRSESATPRGRGTTVTVRDIFAQVPARRALLQRPRAEGLRILSAVRAYALAHPEVAFSLTSDGYLVVQTPGTDLKAAVAATFGADAANALIPFGPAQVDDTLIEGYIASRTFNVPSRQHVIIAVNGRPVNNADLLAAAEAGYRSSLRKGRHPLLVVSLKADPHQLDANIHPAKSEVLLKDERSLSAALRDAISDALGSAPVSVNAAVTQAVAPNFSRPLQLHFPTQRNRRGLRLRETNRRNNGSGYLDEHEEIDLDFPLEPLGQFDDTLILARSNSNALYLVDQHRAHERILFDELLKQRQTVTSTLTDVEPDDADTAIGPAQMLLEPLLVELSTIQAALLVPRLEELRALGFECQPFGGTIFLVRAVPRLPGMTGDPNALASELPQDAAEDSDAWLDHVCARIACRSAIRRGQALSLAEQGQLLQDLSATRTLATCPHGSPLLLRYTRRALARAFEW